MTTRTVLVVSTDELFADAIGPWLGSAGWSVAAILQDGVQALAFVARSRPDRVLLLGHPKRMRSGSFAKQLSKDAASSQIVMVAFDRDRPSGALAPSIGPDELMTALERPEPMATSLDDEGPGIRELAALTTRERQVLDLLARGQNRQEIAAALRISPNTVRTHAQRLYAKLGIHTIAEIVRFAARHGLIGHGDDEDQPGL